MPPVCSLRASPRNTVPGFLDATKEIVNGYIWEYDGHWKKALGRDRLSLLELRGKRGCLYLPEEKKYTCVSSRIVWVSPIRSYSEVQSTYGGITQRWLVVFSQQACYKQLRTFEKNLANTHERNAIDLKHLKNQPFSCEMDALKYRRKVFWKNCATKTLSYRIVRKDVYKNKGRPSKNQSPQERKWYIVGELHSDEETVSKAKQKQGNVLLGQPVSLIRKF